MEVARPRMANSCGSDCLTGTHNARYTSYTIPDSLTGQLREGGREITYTTGAVTHTARSGMGQH